MDMKMFSPEILRMANVPRADLSKKSDTVQRFPRGFSDVRPPTPPKPDTPPEQPQETRPEKAGSKRPSMDKRTSGAGLPPTSGTEAEVGPAFMNSPIGGGSAQVSNIPGEV